MDILNIALEKGLSGEGLSYDEGLLLNNIGEESLFEVIAVSDRVRRAHKSNKINLCAIVNAKSGLCAEDCSFCAQSSGYDTGVKQYPMRPASEIVAAAKRADELGAGEFSIVTSGTKVSTEADVDILVDALKEMNDVSEMERCASIGIASRDTLLRLKEAGLESYHHNLETARSFFPNVCTTHEYDEDIDSIKAAKDLGFYVCSGGIFGLGESPAQRVELAATLRELNVDSVPVNFLDPRPGTPLEKGGNLTPVRSLMVIAMLRFMMPTTNIVVCGGRPKNLGGLMNLIYAAGANGVMIGDYLTTPGADAEADLATIKELGLDPVRSH